MEARAGTEVKAKTLKRETTVDCRDWLEFEVSEILLGKIRYTYRVKEKSCKMSSNRLQLSADRK